MSEPLFWDDDDFMDSLTALLRSDPTALSQCAHLLKPDDFKPLRGMKWGRPRWTVATVELEYWLKFHEPCGRMLLSEVLSYAEKSGQGERQIQELRDYLKRLNTVKVMAPDSVTEKVVSYKRERLKAAGVQEMSRLLADGALTDEKWREISHKALASTNGSLNTVDYFGTLEDRLARRRKRAAVERTPMFLIDPLDILIRGPSPGQLAMILAPYNRGKSLMLLWIAVAYTLQHLNVLFITLEDTRPEVEDRLDAIVTRMPMDKLHDYPATVIDRFGRFKRLVRSKLQVHDGTEGGVSVPVIEQMFLRERERGFTADAIIVDYDDEIQAVAKNEQRRMELADVYRDLRQLAGRRKVIMWTAAQTQRGTEAIKILSGDKAAEDISKLRKATLCVSLGQGDWTAESIYLWVAKHRFDRKHVGCTIIPNLERGLIYDADKTLEQIRNRREKP